ncbi:MAG: META domain-containing protein, partial [Tannerella sp.]|nr:META domain-containing protein [Tannerella sp.]
TYAFLFTEQELKIVGNDGITLLFEPVQTESVAASSPAGIKWKLTGFVDKKTGEARSPKPDDNFYGSYMHLQLWFKTDGSFVGFSSSNDMGGAYILDLSSSTIEIQGGIRTMVGELPDGYLFLDTLKPGARRYEVSDGELRIFGDKDVDLLFKPY